MTILKLTKTNDVKALLESAETYVVKVNKAEALTVGKIEAVLDWTKTNKIKRTDDTVYYISGTLVNDYLYKKAIDNRAKSTIKDGSIYIVVKLNVKAAKFATLDTASIGITDFKSVCETALKKSGVVADDKKPLDKADKKSDKKVDKKPTTKAVKDTKKPVEKKPIVEKPVERVVTSQAEKPVIAETPVAETVTLKPINEA